MPPKTRSQAARLREELDEVGASALGANFNCLRCCYEILQAVASGRLVTVVEDPFRWTTFRQLEMPSPIFTIFLVDSNSYQNVVLITIS